MHFEIRTGWMLLYDHGYWIELSTETCWLIAIAFIAEHALLIGLLARRKSRAESK